jgi:hypothetical protein
MMPSKNTRKDAVPYDGRGRFAALSVANSRFTQPRASDLGHDNAISTRSSRLAHAVVMVHQPPSPGVYHQLIRQLELPRVFPEGAELSLEVTPILE